MDLSDSVLDHLRQVVSLPDLNGTTYEIEREVGRGGIGTVYSAIDRNLDRRVALKVLDVPIDGEARLVARLEHPGVVPVYDSGVLPDGRPFYTMKLITGERLDRYAAGPAVLSDRLRVLRRIAEVLAFAHSHGIAHRDLKPQNVMTGEFGEVYVMDWGIDAVEGSQPFRGPDRVLDARSDIYSFGALMKHVLPDASPRPLQAIALKAVDPDPARRYPDAAALLADLDRYQEGEAVAAWTEPLWHKAYRFGSRHAILLALLAAYVAVKFLLFFSRML